jgi:two-component system chemotaxis response regulator CheY
LNLLIVDDSASVRRLIAEIMTPYAPDIRECSDGAAAVIAYGAKKPDLVLMDIRMSVVDGIQATRQIRALDPAAKIVMVTNLDDPGLREAALREGACGYAVKERLFELPRFIETLAHERTEPCKLCQ